MAQENRSISENDLVVPTRDVEALTIGESSTLRVRAGTAGTVVLVHSSLGLVPAYEVEFPLGWGESALATIEASNLRRCPPSYRRVCECCGCRTLDDLSPGSYEICPVCFWEDDFTQTRYPDLSGGANRPCLMDARKNFAAYGACEERALPHVRAPVDEETKQFWLE
ncbi:CPCC family cysteine-rich protein [Burkholderia sp. LMG 32019]|uniref:CPCC family cysteine-rich protein n=1 Tax=Burkholderia sp. LMG 32019 TaxID=3158173 RepID=UPI003C30835B